MFLSVLIMQKSWSQFLFFYVMYKILCMWTGHEEFIHRVIDHHQNKNPETFRLNSMMKMRFYQIPDLKWIVLDPRYKNKTTTPTFETKIHFGLFSNKMLAFMKLKKDYRGEEYLKVMHHFYQIFDCPAYVYVNVMFLGNEWGLCFVFLFLEIQFLKSHVWLQFWHLQISQQQNIIFQNYQKIFFTLFYHKFYFLLFIVLIILRHGIVFWPRFWHMEW